MGLFLFCLGCPSYGPWTQFPEEDPVWCGPNRRVIREARSVEFVTAGGEIRWRISEDEFLVPKVIAESGITYLEENGIIRKVEGYGSAFSYDFGDYSGFDVILVSVKPTVFVLAKAPLNEQRRWYKNRRIFLIGTDQDRGVEYGTQIPFSDHLFWFSPDFDSGLQPVSNVDDKPREIVVGSGVLSFSKGDDVWEIVRS